MNKAIYKRFFVDCFKLKLSKFWKRMEPEALWKIFSAQVELLSTENEAHHSTGSKIPPVALKI
jgi:glucose-6-phosphate 1-dehydrogenase